MNHQERLEVAYQALNRDASTCSSGLDASQCFALTRLCERFRKKFPAFGQDSIKIRRDAAIQDFLRVNASIDERRELFEESRHLLCGKVPFDWVLSQGRNWLTSKLELYAKALLEAQGVEYIPQTCFPTPQIYQTVVFGPGASTEYTGMTTHPADKARVPWSCTKEARSIVASIRRWNPYLSEADSADPQKGTILCDYATLTVVPKNEEKDRLISIQPLGNMVAQRVLGSYLEDFSGWIGIPIRGYPGQQQKNRDLAQRGSLDDSHVTFDLSDASNHILPSLIRAVWPIEWYTALDSLRVRKYRFDNQEFDSGIFSEMGNGYTFPVMTLTIAALLVGLYSYCKPKRARLSQMFRNGGFAVFGDDIIVPSSIASHVEELLSYAGLKVNSDKSFLSGPFRESCGGDYYCGVDVTPFYIKSLATPAEVYTAINQTIAWCRKTGIWLTDLLRTLLSFSDQQLVPEWMNPYSGIRSLQCPRNFVYLSPIKVKKYHKSDSMTLFSVLCGHYDGQSKNSATFSYLPRPKSVKYTRRRGRIPSGYVEGYDPVLGSYQSSRTAASLLEILMAN